MYSISGEIEGIADFLFNSPTVGDLEKIKAGKTGGKFTDAQRIEQALGKVHRNGQGLYLPAEAFLNCLIEGSKKAGLKEGKKAAWPFLQATVFVDGDLLFGKTEPDYLHEHWGRIPPKTGAVAIIRRPAIKAPWIIRYKLLVADDRRDAGYIKTALEEGGLLVGVGSWRPKYGRFVVKEFRRT